MAQQALRREHDQRQRIGREQQRLAAQQVEVLRGGRAVGQAQVDVGGGLEEALGARRRVIGALAFVAVRQQQHQRRRQAPLGAARGDELVDDHLGAVDEVAVLRLPHDQPARLLDVVAELEADGGGLGERAVADLEGRLGLLERLQRDVALAGDRVVEDGVAVAERAALDVLAGEADRDAVGEDRGERQLLGGGPVDRPLVRVGQHQLAALAGAIELAVLLEAGRPRQQRGVERLELRQRHGGLHLTRGAGRRRLGDRLDEVALRLERRQRFLEHREVAAVHHLRGVGGDLAAGDQLIGPQAPHRRVRGDLGVEERLREARLVAFVVTVAAIADQVDDDVLEERRPVGAGDARRFEAGDRVVGVDVDDRDLVAARQAARVRRAVGFARRGGEADLVVHDHVDRAAGRIAVEPRQVQRLGDDALAGERRVAVDQDRQRPLRIEA